MEPLRAPSAVKSIDRARQRLAAPTSVHRLATRERDRRLSELLTALDRSRRGRTAERKKAEAAANEMAVLVAPRQRARRGALRAHCRRGRREQQIAGLIAAENHSAREPDNLPTSARGPAPRVGPGADVRASSSARRSARSARRCVRQARLSS